MFEDPYCGYCKSCVKVFAEMDDITVYTFMVAPSSARIRPPKLGPVVLGGSHQGL